MTTSVNAGTMPSYNGHGCGACYEENKFGGCNLLSSLSTILYYFSDIISYEEVAVEMVKGKYEIKYKDTAQNVCFSVCVYAMFNSSCKFFSKFRFLLRYYHANFDPDAYMHMVLTTSLIRRQVDLKSVHDHVDLFHEVARFNEEFQKRLQFVLREAKFYQDKDAAINAINIAFSLNTLATEDLKDFYEDFLHDIKMLK